tara:strand:+ start:190 stop:312 length:123 start_codon:yes stop_codon:yes gene_type:complete
MEILWATGGFFVVLAAVTKFIEHTNRKEAYNRAVKIARGK